MQYLKGMKVKICEAYFLGKFPNAVFAGVRTVTGEIVSDGDFEGMLKIKVAECDAPLPVPGQIISRRQTGVFRRIEILSPQSAELSKESLVQKLCFELRNYPNAADLVGNLVNNLQNQF